MRGVTVRAASVLDRGGFGIRGRGMSPWPAAQARALGGDPAALVWPAFLASPCPRFGRMDALSKLGVLAVELLGIDFAALPGGVRENLGVCLETRDGAIDSDRRFLATSSPTVFTYTLPSTVLGELCIRHRLQGPVLCLMAAAPGGRGALDQAVEWLASGEVAACLALGCESEDRTACAAFLEQGTDPVPGLSLMDWCRDLAGGRLAPPGATR